MTTTRDVLDSSIPVHLVNVPRLKPYNRFLNSSVDERFAEVLDKVAPDVVHFNHLNHLSLGLPALAKERSVNTVFTLHDFWNMCPRGQFLMDGETPAEPSDDILPLCSGQEDTKCAMYCFRGFHSGDPERLAEDTSHWMGWVRARQAAIRTMLKHVDTFISPSRVVQDSFQTTFDRSSKLLHYGFDRQRYAGRERVSGPFTFGYIGRIQPGKGLHQLLQAFASARKFAFPAQVCLKIWGAASEAERANILQSCNHDDLDGVSFQVSALEREEGLLSNEILTPLVELRASTTITKSYPLFSTIVTQSLCPPFGLKTVLWFVCSMS